MFQKKKKSITTSTKGFFKGDDGGRSSMRLVWIFVTVVVIGAWATISVHNWKVEPIGYDLTSLIVLLSGTKVAQKLVENGDISLKFGEKKIPPSGEPKPPANPEPIKPPKE
jgi:hypothetical protein